MSRGRPLLLLFIVLFAGTVMMCGCQSSGPAEVLAIEKTRMYHRKTCPPVHMARTVSMTISQARALHYSPCPICKPTEQ